METYIAYFDVLGFKEFIDCNSKEYVDRNFSYIFRESQTAISGEKYVQAGFQFVPDLSLAEINCLHFSDSIIFWSKDKTEDSFRKIVDVCFTFYWRCMQTCFPVRGCLVLGQVEFQPFQIPSSTGSSFYNSSLYGNGLIQAYLKAEQQDWAGCYIDETALNNVDEKVIYDLLSTSKIVYYAVPNKDGSCRYEHTIRIITGNLNNLAFRNFSKSVERVFTQHMNGKPLTESVKRKMFNTIKFLEFFKVEEESSKAEKRKDQ